MILNVRRQMVGMPSNTATYDQSQLTNIRHLEPC
jgi:hypothetical protein